MSPKRTLLVALVPFSLTACEQLGIDDPAKVTAMREAEGRAVGSGCRHTGRTLEGCYKANSRVSKAAILAGWREMDGYMRENKIDTLKPEGAGVETTENPEEKAEGKAEEKADTAKHESADGKEEANAKPATKS